MKRLSLVVVVLLAVVAAGCQRAAGLTEEDKAAIAKVHQDAVTLANTPPTDYAAYVKGYYAPDAEVLMPNMPAVKGAAAIEQALASYPPMTSFKTDIVSLDGRGDLAYARGSYTMTLAPPGVPAITDHGKYIEVWKKQAGGEWRVAYDSFSTDLPPAGPTLSTTTMAADASPEVQALAVMAGRWETEGKPLDPALGPGTAKGTHDCTWFAGGRQLLCSAVTYVQDKRYDGVSVFYYDRGTKSYKVLGVSSNEGETGPAELQVKPGTWVIKSSYIMDGKPVKDQMTLFDITADGGRWKSELSLAGGPMKPMAEGTFRKVKTP